MNSDLMENKGGSSQGITSRGASSGAERLALSLSNAAPPLPSVQHLPVEMAVLVRCGLSLDDLFAAFELAQAQGVGLDELALAEGYVTADEFYKMVARILRRPFIDYEVRLSQRRNVQGAIASGIAQIRDEGAKSRYIIAPAAANLRFLLQNTSARRADFVITTPSHLRQLVLAQASEFIKEEASFGLWRKNASLSARDGMNTAQYVVLCMVLTVLAFAGVQNFAVTLSVAGLICNALTAAFISHRLMATWASAAPHLQKSPALVPEFALPRYTVIVALYREADVVPGLLQALMALDYPRAKLDILFVLEQDDPETHAALLHCAPGATCQIIIAPPGLPRTKPRALNVALPFVRGEFLCVYDAEDVPDPDQLQKVVAAFAASGAQTGQASSSRPLACVQARLAVENSRDSLLTRFFAIEYAGLFDVLNAGLSDLGLGFPLGGTSNHFRTEILRQVGGWDAWNVTEDADLGIRLIRSGYRSQMIDSTTWEEAPIGLSAWMGQRRRWVKGWMQTLIVHTRALRTLAAGANGLSVLDIILNVAGTLITVLTAPASTLFLLYMLCFDPDMSLAHLQANPALSFSMAVSALGLVSIYWTGFLGVLRRGPLMGWLFLPLLPLYFILVSVAAWWSIYDLIAKPFVWLKTMHGLTGKHKIRDGFSRHRIYAGHRLSQLFAVRAARPAPLQSRSSGYPDS